VRIAYLSNSCLPSRKANSVHVMAMCQAFARAGNEVTLFARRGGEPAEDLFQYYGVEPCFQVVMGCCPPWSGHWGRGLAYTADVARRVLRSPRPDLLYSRSCNCLAVLAPFGIPMAFEVHDLPRPGLEDRVLRWLMRRSNLVRVIAITESLRQEYLRLIPWLPPERVFVAPDGADVPPKGLALPPDRPWPGRAGRVQVGYVGSLQPGRGVEIIAALAARLQEMDFHVIGGTEDQVEGWRRRASATGNLHVHGFVPPAVATACRQMMDILLTPYQERTLCVDDRGQVRDTTPGMSPLKVFEAMAAGKAIVSSDLPALREVLTHDVNALLVPPADVEAWADAIGFLARHTEAAERLARQALDDLRAKYSWQVRATNILAELLGAEPRAQPQQPADPNTSRLP